MHDKRARDILFETFWKNGWRAASDRAVTVEDFTYAKDKGYMFDAVSLSHDDVVSHLIEEREQADREALSHSFVASLGSRRLDLRSGLGSYAFALNFPRHQIATTPFTIVPSGARQCEWCGLYERQRPTEINLNVLSFERLKWGGVRRDDPVYAWLDLSLFRKAIAQRPTSADKHIMGQILKTARSMEPDATAGSLERALTGVIKSSKSERRSLIEILAICGILQPRNRSGYLGEFTFACDREQSGQHFNDWCYPAVWWRGSDGVNDTALAAFFPDL